MPFLVGSDFKPPIQYWLEYISSRGLKPESLDAAGIKYLDGATLAKNYGNWVLLDGAVGGAVIPATGRIDCEHKKIRFFYGPQVPSTSGKSPAKYKGLRGQPNSLYVPPILTDWYSGIYTLFIVEGEMAALRLAQDGYHAVAIGGVENFRTGDKLTKLIPELVTLTQYAGKMGQKVCLFYDSDASERVKLMNSLNKLAAELAPIHPLRSAGINMCFPFSNEDGSKNGPDDYLQKRGIDEFNRLIRENSIEFNDHPWLRRGREWADRVIYVENVGKYYDQVTGTMCKKEHINDVMAKSPIFNLGAKPAKYTAESWLESEYCRRAHSSRFNSDTDDCYYQEPATGLWHHNLYDPRDVPEEVEGDITPFLKLLDHLCVNSPSAIPKIKAIIAAHIQVKSIQPMFAIMLSGEPGCGKSIFARSIGMAITKSGHYSNVNLKDTFNSEWITALVKEWAEYNPDMDPEWLKGHITEFEHKVRAFQTPPYLIPNRTLNIITMNQLKGYLQEGDRRWVTGGFGKRLDPLTGKNYYDWLMNGGYKHIRHYFMHKVDAQSYYSMDSSTEFRDKVIDASKDRIHQVFDEVMEDLESVDGLEIISNNMLTALLDQRNVRLKTFTGVFGHIFVDTALSNVKCPEQNRFKAFKNQEKWEQERDTQKYRDQYSLAVKQFSYLGKKY